MRNVFLSILVIACLSFKTGNPISDDLPINRIQVIGSHNSYKQSIDPVLFKFIKEKDSVGSKKIDYSHITLSQQLDLGLLDLEIDIYADTKGGRYAHPKGLAWAPGQAPYDKDGVMNEPGFKVFHIQDIDFRSNCFTFKQCLQELRQWSDQHKDHDVIFITMNAKDERMKKPYYTIPETFTSAIFDQLDKALLENLGRERLVVPDDVRGKYKTLQSAVIHGNWPRVKQAKGKFIFVLDEVGKKRAAYIAGHPSLKNRVLFTDSEPGTPESAIHIMNNPKKDLKKIKALVKKGYIIRTRADSDTEEARDNDKSTFEAALASDAQIITTDYYQKSTHFKSDYVVSFGDGTYCRPNPLFK
ncbi:phosphatidylinositol-specific phospholipase C1-like protein [Mucilaginibacter flavidus]|uniref:phosphatidylinositol-specific phospholipase C1-like protein n=1 Tax=Mucilaginibacter flavidus TaxID=2949309 RepID=UPI00209251FD|nr:phosphatidylinositol-specific phospholipase C1-like protein [Mucilaginibacter flavidus]MCO5946990.1 phosphatidylinositol-specific phospholipase C1-like protein [Mucilaginibacter flavidus]